MATVSGPEVMVNADVIMYLGGCFDSCDPDCPNVKKILNTFARLTVCRCLVNQKSKAYFFH